MVIDDVQPDHRDARARELHGYPVCGACGGTLAHKDQVRCPYVACRAWLRGALDPAPKTDKERAKETDHA